MRKIGISLIATCILLVTTLFSGCIENKPPTAQIQVDQDSGYVPSSVHFTGSGTDTDGSIKSYLWNFGDGSTSYVQNPSHTYSNVGTYSVTLTVTDNSGGTGIDTEHIVVTVKPNIPPEATASANPTTGYHPLAVTFAGSGTDTDGYIVSYSWSFGDGVSSSQQNPTHTYNTHGTYKATFMVYDDNGASDSRSITITVQNYPPTASASANPSSGKVPLKVTFSGSGTDSDGYISSYSWSFGDGESSSQQNPTHTYTTEGTYSATLTVTDDDGSIGTRTVTITVYTNQPPIASASANPRSGPAPLPVAFTGSGTDSDGYIVSYSWSFGDGESSSQQNPTHTYTTEGTYSAKLTVTDNGGKTGDKTITITVNKPPEYPKSITYSTQVNLTIVTDAFSITTDGTYYYVIDQTKRNVYKYDSSYTYTGTWFSYSQYTTYARGITYHNGDLYIVGTRSYWWSWYREIFKFSTNGYYEGKWDIGAHIGDPKSINSDGQYLYVGDLTAPYKIAYFDSSTMSYQGYIPNSHPPHGIAIDKSANWYFITSWGGDVNRIYLCTMNGVDQWSTTFDPYIEDIVIIDNTLIRIDGKFLYIYNINY